MEQLGTFSSRALWCSNSDLRAFSTSTSLETPEGDWAWRFTTVIRNDRSWRDTRHSRCSRSSWQRAEGEGKRTVDMFPKDYKAGPTGSPNTMSTMSFSSIKHLTPARLSWPLPQNFNPVVTQEPQVRTQCWELSTTGLPITPGWEAEPAQPSCRLLLW